MTPEVRSWCWPLPWWAALGPALVVAIVSAAWVGQVAAGAPLSRTELSGLGPQSVVLSGPLAAMAAGWVGARFLGAHSPLGQPWLARRANAPLRVALAIGAWWTAGQVLGVGGVSILVAGAERGTFYPQQSAVMIPMLDFFILLGLIIGVNFPLRRAIVLAAVGSLMVIFALPFLVGPLATGTATAQSLYVATTPVVAHGPIVLGGWLAVIGWWIGAVAAAVVVLAVVVRRRIGLGRGAIVGVVVLGCLVIVAGAAVMVAAPPIW